MSKSKTKGMYGSDRRIRAHNLGRARSCAQLPGLWTVPSSPAWPDEP